MQPLHIVTEKENIAPLVLLPGDPLRAKYIAENFLNNPKQINTVRNMFGYTGYYKGTRITVIGSGMGCPSVGIYSYELFNFYDVEKIIRIGTSGAFTPEIKILDVVLSIGAYSESTFAYSLNGCKDKYIPSSMELNTQIAETAEAIRQPLKFGPTITSDTLDLFLPIDHIIDKCPIKDKLVLCEMEGFALFHTARVCGKQASMLCTITDSKFEPDNTITTEDRQNSLNAMIKLALESIIK